MHLEIVKDNKTALVFGATGLVGKFLTDFLLQHPAYQKVIVFSRKPLQQQNVKLVQHVINFDRLKDYKHLIHGDDLFCCLGTTMAKAGSKETFYKVDFTYTHQIASIAAQNQIKQFLLVSAVGANPYSIFFYNRVKGELEEAVKKLSFWSIHIFQPSILLGERIENRTGERIAGVIGRCIDRVTGGLLSKHRPVEAEVVAQAMVSVAQRLKLGIHVYPSHWFQMLAREMQGATT